VTPTSELLLGAIALGVVIMAAIQVGALIYGSRLARRIEALVGRVERDTAPMIERLTAMSGEASRAAALAALQVEKVDRLVTDVSERVDRSMAAAQRALLVPAREGVALAAAVRTTLDTLRELRRQQRAGRQAATDDDALFIG
jgi:hypothetical protein